MPEDIGKEILNLPVKTGAPEYVGEYKTKPKDHFFATALGLPISAKMDKLTLAYGDMVGTFTGFKTAILGALKQLLP